MAWGHLRGGTDDWESLREAWGQFGDTWEVALVTLRVTWSDIGTFGNAWSDSGTLGRWHWVRLESLGVA